VSPADGWDKGIAVRAMLDHLGTDPFPVYAGDAADDVEALAAVEAWGGLGVGVGPSAPARAARMESPAELLGTLGRFGRALCAVVEARRAGGWRPAAPEGPPAAAGLLLVEPLPAIRRAEAAGLERCGWRVWAVADADAALAALAAGRDEIRAALVDVGLPGLSAARLLADLAAAKPGLVRCLTSGRLSPFVEAAYRQVNDLPLFSKPLEFDRLTNRLRHLLARQRRGPQETGL
jgi:CheY-like chemotaxis protein